MTTEQSQSPETKVDIPPTQNPGQTGQTQPANTTTKPPATKTVSNGTGNGEEGNPEEETVRKSRGTDHYMHFLICVFCPWWLLIWIAMCIRDIYTGACCDDIDE